MRIQNLKPVALHLPEIIGGIEKNSAWGTKIFLWGRDTFLWGESSDLGLRYYAYLKMIAVKMVLARYFLLGKDRGGNERKIWRGSKGQSGSIDISRTHARTSGSRR